MHFRAHPACVPLLPHIYKKWSKCKVRKSTQRGGHGTKCPEVAFQSPVFVTLGLRFHLCLPLVQLYRLPNNVVVVSIS